MAHCPICNDTGEAHGNYGMLDCAAPGCTAAVERAALNEFTLAQRRALPSYDLDWAIHQRAVAMTEKACAERIAAQAIVARLPD